ncbi:MAG TPA: hypothetical protein VL995_19010 [Cellvibrio sp.]|nr:hypothetical protein [Cellvibrio sp.]
MTSLDQQEPQQPSQPQSLPATSEIKKTQKVSSNWPLGLAVVIIGGLLLARNLGVELFFLDFHNWWAFFILLLAIGPLQLAIRCYRREGFGAATLNALVSTVAIIFVALIFLIDLSWGTWWPMFIIIGGLYVITNRS